MLKANRAVSVYVVTVIWAILMLSLGGCSDKPAFSDTVNTRAIIKINQQALKNGVIMIDVDERSFFYGGDTLFEGNAKQLLYWEDSVLQVLDSSGVSEMNLLDPECTYVQCNDKSNPESIFNGGFVLFNTEDGRYNFINRVNDPMNNDIKIGDTNDSLAWFGHENRGDYFDYLIGRH